VTAKNHALLIDAFSDSFGSDAAVRLLLAGEGQLRPDLERRAAERGIAAQVEFLGTLAAAYLVWQIP